MHDLMVACQEISLEDVALVRAERLDAVAEQPLGADDSAWTQVRTSPPLPKAAVADQPLEADDSGEVVKALAWATGLKDHALIVGLAESLPDVVLEEQRRAYRAREPKKPKTEPLKILVYPHLLRSRMQVAAAWNADLRRQGWVEGTRLPHGACSQFMASRLIWSRGTCLSERRKIEQLRRWHQTWLADTRLQHPSAPTQLRRSRTTLHAWSNARRRQHTEQGRPVSCPWLRQTLYEWFVATRYSIDWKRVQQGFPKQQSNKCMARFSRALVRQKAKQLLQDYCRESLMWGVKLQTVELSARWFHNWESEYGLSMRKPNRKYKVPKAVMAERLEVGWCNVARVRALCLATLGYDPEIENWDQSPFHNNESGSQNVSTLAVAGGTVPLIEGHADTRERWTGNFTTFSNKARLMAEGPPYCEFVFKANGERLQLRLREYIRSRGFGPWVSVATSEKGSYRTHDVLSFLDRHLPTMSHGRQWRIIMADDYSAHLSPQVFRLCWSRGYVFVAHGGGVTPVVQTPDTDLNQHVKREYAALETAELLQQMREGVCVPRCTHERCMDLMVRVMSQLRLHLGAAEGYLKTGMTVALDGTQDNLVVREAGVFWQELHMRTKINAAVADVYEEVREGRLSWNVHDVKRLIKPYIKHKHIDAVLEKMHDDTWVPEGEAVFEDDDAKSSSGSSDDEGEEIAAADAADVIAVADAADEAEAEGPPDAPSSSAAAEGPGSTAAEMLVATDPATAERLTKSQQLIATYESAIISLKDAGAMRSVVNLENEIKKEKRRMRAFSREDPEVLLALAQRRDHEEAQERQRQQTIAVANARTLTAAKLRQEIKDNQEILKKRKREILDAECLLEMKHAMKTYSLVDLGDGRSCGGKASGKKRHEVLDRLFRSCGGLSPAQKNDFAWWKDAWDKTMLEEYGAEWARVFAEWVQKVLADFENGVGNAFSLFVHAETRRCFHDVLALQVP